MIPTSKLLPLCQECLRQSDTVLRPTTPESDGEFTHLSPMSNTAGWLCKSTEQEAPKRRRQTK